MDEDHNSEITEDKNFQFNLRNPFIEKNFDTEEIVFSI